MLLKIDPPLITTGLVVAPSAVDGVALLGPSSDTVPLLSVTVPAKVLPVLLNRVNPVPVRAIVFD
jgi:hypothetical protein